jgi:hypothetical protein
MLYARYTIESVHPMTSYTPVPDPVTPAWLTAVLGEGGLLGGAEVLSATSMETGAFNSATSRLQLRYSAGAAPDLPAQLILKRNISEPWAVEAGAAEVAFYRQVAALDPPPPAIVPCYAAAYDPASGDSYLLLLDLSETHAPPVTRDQQVSIVEAVPSAAAIERVVGTLAQHHASWRPGHSRSATGRATPSGSRCISSGDAARGRIFSHTRPAGFLPSCAICMSVSLPICASIGSAISSRAFATT